MRIGYNRSNTESSGKLSTLPAKYSGAEKSRTLGKTWRGCLNILAQIPQITNFCLGSSQ
ncbi:13651_t:CDS:2 [Funneliformis geosporum]|uniref:10928_t:CDS:1 n=1 Tax=Funneliformis geosporum TaxID=1117311 RepID=A0A9W4SU43_9GLOM|nr:13651_t:CDS:2 [Funneliformis geosporum]CAI2180631.1 10928_t:CDS:2 [Funneliformis geosporum]